MILSLENITKYYGKLKAVDSVDISIEENGIIAILGSNGAGKSTIIKMICGLLKPTSGSIRIQETTYDEDPDRIRQQIGYVPEESAMYNDLGVYDYLRFFADLYGVPGKLAEARIEEHLRSLHLDVGNRTIAELSKGMKRKVLIARSLINDPDILIYDEPASGLDPQTAAFILQFMEKLVKEGKTILFSSHNLGHVEQVADRVIIIHKGQKLRDATVDELKRTKKVHYTLRYREDGETKEKKIHLQDLDQYVHLDVIAIVPEQRTLEEAFLSLVE